MIAVYRGVFVDDCPIWSGKMISFASYVAAFAFKIGYERIARFDAMVDRMAETHRLIRDVDFDGEESVGGDFDRGLWKDFRLFELGWR
jgi:hypothetical protein